MKRFSLLLLVLLSVGCGEKPRPPVAVRDTVTAKMEMPVKNGAYKVGKPYEIFGITYYPKEDYEYKEMGIASWYGADFHGGVTANGEQYDMNSMTAAHRTLPLPSVVRVTNLRNNRSVILRVNDRGPFVNNRIIDVSKRAAELLDFQVQGTAEVMVEIMPDESIALKEAILNREQWSVKDRMGFRGSDGAALVGNLLSSDINAVPINPEPATFDKDDQSVIGFSSASKFYVQVGAFSVYDNAVRLKDNLARFGRVVIAPVSAQEITLYRVRLGPYRSQLEALNVYNQIAGFGHQNAKILSEE